MSADIRKENAMGNYLINMPDIGEGIVEVEIVEWPISNGDSVHEDDVICVVMTDKATVEIPSPVDGKIVWLGAKEGEVLAVGAELIRIEVAGEGNTESDVATPAESKLKVDAVVTVDVEAETVPVKQKETVVVKQPSAIPTETAPRPEGEKPIASPAVRQRARNAGVDLRFVQGSGPANRISHEDLDSFLTGNSTVQVAMDPGAIANTSVEKIKIIGMRRKISEIMQDTMQRIPHFTYVEEIDVTELESLRAKLNKERHQEQPKLTLLPFIIKAIVKAIKVYPEMSSRFDDQENIVHRYGAVHVGIATQTDNGLVVPVVKHAESLDIWQSAAEVKRLSTGARDGIASREELSGSTITITSLGSMGGIVTTPVINSPEVAIIGINKIAKRPVWQDGGFVARDIMNLSSSFDHRIIDGWEATCFIQQIKGLLEAPATMFMEN